MLNVIRRAGASGPPTCMVGGSTGRPPVCTCNVQSASCQLLLIKVCWQATGLFLGVETCTCVLQTAFVLRAVCSGVARMTIIEMTR